MDKSLLIKDILDNSSESILITRPRRWGKTINMDMLKTFFQPEVNMSGDLDLSKQSQTRKIFEGGVIEVDEFETKTLHPLKIAQIDNGKYLKKQGKYPVIFMTFANVLDKKDLNQESLLLEIRKTISLAYQEHKYCYERLLNQVEQG